MSFDGVFIRHLCRELQNTIKGARVNRVKCLDKAVFVLELSKGSNLLFSLSGAGTHFRLIRSDYTPSGITFPFLTALRKHLESGYIADFYQIENDRIVVFEIEKADYLGYRERSRLIGEMFGRNANLILTDEKGEIIDSLRKTYVLNDNDKRIVVPKAKYQIPAADAERVNPFATDAVCEQNIYQGVSNLCYGEIAYRRDLSFLDGPTTPVLIKQDNKTRFYCLDLTHIEGERQYFPDLSSLLEEYFLTIRKLNIHNAEQKILENYLKRETNKVRNKLKKQREEFRAARENLNLKETGDLLAASLHLIREGDNKITVWDFYRDEKREITLNPKLSPAENMEAVFAKYRKAKRTIESLNEQIKATEEEIRYLETLEEQIAMAGTGGLREIIEELGLVKAKQASKKKPRPQYLVYKDGAGNMIMVGKNNLQNNYLTHRVARKNDYFFHVKGAPGSHTILRAAEPTNEAITLAATIAAYHSKNRYSANVAVDYTLVKHVKKIPGARGSFVTYSNHKTVFVTPDWEFIKNSAT
ncbi:MAG: Rqc2 family fibronectin-binding protein [Bacilli bacterium]|jgi:predicted ribosome quality control (RQC) complex YloA/Tae2 family protein